MIARIRGPGRLLTSPRGSSRHYYLARLVRVVWCSVQSPRQLLLRRLLCRHLRRPYHGLQALDCRRVVRFHRRFRFPLHWRSGMSSAIPLLETPGDGELTVLFAGRRLHDAFPPGGSRESVSSPSTPACGSPLTVAAGDRAARALPKQRQQHGSRPYAAAKSRARAMVRNGVDNHGSFIFPISPHMRAG